MKDRNIGKNGFDSVRINGLKVENLPLGQGNEAKQGIPGFLKTDKETKINNIKAKYPSASKEYLSAALKECKNNIQKIKQFKENLKSQISEYRSLIRDCDYRESELQKYCSDNNEDLDKIKQIKLKYPPYSVEALSQQILQFEQSIDRCDEVIEQDYQSISEISSAMTLVERRDKEIASVK